MISFIIWGIFWNVIAFLVLIISMLVMLLRYRPIVRDRVVGFMRLYEREQGRNAFGITKWIFRSTFIIPFVLAIYYVIWMVILLFSSSMKYGFVSAYLLMNEFPCFPHVDQDKFFREYYPGENLTEFFKN